MRRYLVQLFEAGKLTGITPLTQCLRLSAPEAGDWLAIEATGSNDKEAEAKALNDRLASWVFQISPARAKLLRMTLPDFLLPRGS